MDSKSTKKGGRNHQTQTAASISPGEAKHGHCALMRPWDSIRKKERPKAPSWTEEHQIHTTKINSNNNTWANVFHKVSIS